MTDKEKDESWQLITTTDGGDIDEDVKKWWEDYLTSAEGRGAVVAYEIYGDRIWVKKAKGGGK